MNCKPTYGREEFFAAYSAFCESTDRIYQEILLIRKLPVDTYQLWAAVREQGGHEKVQLKKLWASTARRFNHPKSWTNASHYFKTTYEAAGLAQMEDLVDSGQFSIADYAPGGPLYNPHWRQQQQQHNPLQQQQQQLLAVALDQDRSAIDLDHQQQQQLLDLSDPAAAAVYAQQQQQQQGRLSSSSGGSSMTGLTGSVIGLRLVVKCGTAHGLFDLARQRAICLCDGCSGSSGGVGVEMMPTEFERHGGCGSFKKWKKSIMVEETGRNIGSWLTAHGLEILSPSALTKKAKRRQMAAEAAAAAAARGQQQQQQVEVSGVGSHGDGGWQQQQQQVVQRSSSLAMHLPTAAAVALAAAMQGRTVQQQQQQREFRGVGRDPLHYGGSAVQQHWQQQQQHGPRSRSTAAGPLMQQQQQQKCVSVHVHDMHQNARYLDGTHDYVNRKESTWSSHREQGYSDPDARSVDLDLHRDHHHPDHRDPRFSDLRSSDPRFSHLDHPGFCDQISSPAGFSHLDPNRVGSGGFSDSPEGPSTAAAAGLAARSGSGQRLRDVAAAAALVGRQIKVWWPLDQEWYTATVQSYNPQQHLHGVVYDDEDIEQLNLLEEQWELMPDHRSDHGPDYDHDHRPDHRFDHRSDHGPDYDHDHRPDHRFDHRSDHDGSLPDHDLRDQAVREAITGHQTAATAAQAVSGGYVQGSPAVHGTASAAAAAGRAPPAAAAAEGQQHPMFQHRQPLQGIKVLDPEAAAAMHDRDYDINNAPEGSPVLEVQQQQQSMGHANASTMDQHKQGHGCGRSNVSLHGVADPDQPDLDRDDVRGLGRSDLDQETLDDQAAESAWLLAAQQSVADRPLRVIYDSHAGLIRIVLAADLLELAMRRQQQQWLRRQQQRWLPPAEPAAATAGEVLVGTKRQRAEDTSGHKDDQPVNKRRIPSQRDQQQQQQSVSMDQDQPADLHRYREVGHGYEVSYIPDLPGFEVLCLIPGYTINQIRIKAWNDGRLLIKAVQDGISTSAAASAGERDDGAGLPAERVIQLPARISAQSAQAMMTQEGQLYVRVQLSC